MHPKSWYGELKGDIPDLVSLGSVGSKLISADFSDQSLWKYQALKFIEFDWSEIPCFWAPIWPNQVKNRTLGASNWGPTTSGPYSSRSFTFPWTWFGPTSRDVQRDWGMVLIFYETRALWAVRFLKTRGIVKFSIKKQTLLFKKLTIALRDSGPILAI